MQILPGLIDQYPLMGLFLLFILGTIGLPIPEDITLLVCGFLIANGVLPAFPAVVLIYGFLVGLDILFFFAGRTYGREVVNHRLFRRVLSKERMAQLEEYFAKRGLLLVVFGRHVVVLSTQLLIAAGIFRMQPYKFVAADLITVPITMGIMIGLGYAGGNSLQIVEKDVTRVEHLALLAVVSGTAIYLLLKSWKGRRS